jgi:hypothetical protein
MWLHTVGEKEKKKAKKANHGSANRVPLKIRPEERGAGDERTVALFASHHLVWGVGVERDNDHAHIALRPAMKSIRICRMLPIIY